MGTSKPSSRTPAEDPGGAGGIADEREPPPIRGGPADRTVAFEAASPLLSIAFGDDAGFVDESASRSREVRGTIDRPDDIARGLVARTVQLHALPIPATEGGDGGLGRMGRDGGRYRVIREIGRGGMGVVYEAWDLQLERVVAVKSLKVRRDQPTELMRFLREAKIASRLNHPGIMAVHEFGFSDDDRAFMVMRLLRGQTLRQILDDRSTSADDLPRLLTVFLQACQAVASAHAVGVIHRDLKPANIMVGEYSRVTVMDWGLAKVLGEEAEELPPVNRSAFDAADGGPEVSSILHTVSGTIVGTPGYLAPEQARGDTERVDRRSDVFGLGCILCEILTGSPPYRAGTFSDTWRQAANGDTAAALARLDACGSAEALVRLAHRCLSIDPDSRPAEACELVDALVAHLESGQKRAEQQLVRFFDLSVDLFCIASLSGYFRRVNGNFVRVLGHPEGTLLQQRFLEFVHPDDREKTLSEVARLSRGETTIQFHNRYRRIDGDYVWLEWNARAVPEEGVIYAVARDVTALARDRQLELLLEDRDALRARVDTLERLVRGGGA